MILMPAAFLLTGCTPQDAEIQANYAAYLGYGSSENLTNLERRGTDVQGAPGKLGLTPVDCRDLTYLETDEEIAAARLEGVDFEQECCNSPDAGCHAPQPKWFDWLDDYGYYLNEGTVDPWRTEAVLTTEGDLQLTVHMDVPTFGDFRFAFVIDPNFQPTECVDAEDGSVEQDVDGNWLENWSTDEEGTLWHLNAGNYQINPSNNGEAWYFDQDWMAGSAFARFGDEEFYNNGVDYNDPYYRPFYLGTYTGDCGDGGDNDSDGDTDSSDTECRQGKSFEGSQIPASPGFGESDEASVANLDEWAAEVDAYFNGSDTVDPIDDLSGMGKSSFPLKMKIENNSWRPIDDDSTGLDGWLGVSPSWVRITNPEDIKVHPDKPITGEFQMYLAGLSASSKLLVGGTFTLNDIRGDVWGYSRGTLEDVKEEENNTPACGE